MSCGCIKKRTDPVYEKLVKQAMKEAKLDKVNYVIYEIDGKIYYDKKTCWENAGREGTIKELISYL